MGSGVGLHRLHVLGPVDEAQAGLARRGGSLRVVLQRGSGGLPDAVELIGVTADVAFAADLAGLDFGDLDAEDQQLLEAAQRRALRRGIEAVQQQATAGDQRARRWLRDHGLSYERPMPKRRTREPVAASRS